VGKRLRVVGQVPAHRGGQVARLALQPLGPLVLVEAPQRPVGLLGQRPVVVGVAALDLGAVGPARQPFGDELPDGLQHPRPGTVVGAVELDQAVADQRFGELQRPVLVQGGHLGGGLDRPAVDEHGHGLQQRPLGLLQQADAPVDGGAQGALALGQVHAPVPNASSEVASRSSSASGSSSRIRAAASSIANGSPSR
jgi:hypothetical protein